MAAKLTYLYDLKEEVSLNLTVDQITSTIIFGTTGVAGLYDPEKTYKLGDIVPYIDENGIIHIYECTAESTTGPFNPEHWREFSIIGKLKLIRDNLIVLSAMRPTDITNNKVWIRVKSDDSGSIDLGDNVGMMIVGNFILSVNEPSPFTTDLIWGKITSSLTRIQKNNYLTNS